MNPNSERICFVKGCNKVLTGECCRLPSNMMRGVEILEFIGREELILTPYEYLREICFMCKDHFEVVPDEPTAFESENSNVMSETENNESIVSESASTFDIPEQNATFESSENITSSNSDEEMSVNLTICNILTKCWTDGCDKLLQGQECYGLPNHPIQAVRIFKFIGREDLMFFPFEQIRPMVFVCKEHFDESKNDDDVSQNTMSQYSNNFVPNTRQMSPAVPNKITYQIMPNSQSASSSSSSSDSSAAGSATYHSDDDASQGSMMVCKLCDYKLNGIEHFRRHMKARHCGMFCDRCDKAFVSPNYLRTHQRRHSTSSWSPPGNGFGRLREAWKFVRCSSFQKKISISN